MAFLKVENPDDLKDVIFSIGNTIEIDNRINLHLLMESIGFILVYDAELIHNTSGLIYQGTLNNIDIELQFGNPFDSINEEHSYPMIRKTFGVIDNDIERMTSDVAHAFSAPPIMTQHSFYDKPSYLEYTRYGEIIMIMYATHGEHIRKNRLPHVISFFNDVVMYSFNDQTKRVIFPYNIIFTSSDAIKTNIYNSIFVFPVDINSATFKTLDNGSFSFMQLKNIFRHYNDLTLSDCMNIDNHMTLDEIKMVEIAVY